METLEFSILKRILEFVIGHNRYLVYCLEEPQKPTRILHNQLRRVCRRWRDLLGTKDVIFSDMTDYVQYLENQTHHPQSLLLWYPKYLAQLPKDEEGDLDMEVINATKWPFETKESEILKRAEKLRDKLETQVHKLSKQSLRHLLKVYYKRHV
jgi:hypothetical protein